MTDQGKDSIKTKWAERLTPERREQFATETIEARKKAETIRKEEADKFANKYISIIKEKQKMGFNLVEIAKQLNEEGHKSRRGSEWTDQTVRQILKRVPEPIVIKPLTQNKTIESEIFRDVPLKRRVLGWDK